MGAMPLFKKAVFLSLILLLQSGAGIFGSAVILDTSFSGLIQQGVTVKGIPIGGLKPVEAALELQNNLPFPGASALKIEDTEKSYIIELSGIDARYDYLSTANEALEYINKGKYINQLISVLRLRAAPDDLALKVVFSEEKLEDRIKNLQEEWDTPPQDAVVTMSGDKVVIVSEKTGYSLDFERTLEQTRQELTRGNLHVAASARIPILKPNITSVDLKGINTLLGEYTTVFDDNAVNRSHNIALASATVNGAILRPGEMFSLNERLGPRLAETGYLMAPVFIDDDLALDIGGGICQVATTLYNAVIFADLPVVERYTHPQPVNYAPPDRDATIAGDYLDFKFSNNMNTPLYISSLVESGTLTIRIFGGEKNRGSTVRISPEKVVIDPKIIIIRDNTLPEGETRVINPGKPGYEIRVYQEVVVDGKVTSKTLISSDHFEPEDKIIHVNPRPHEEEK